MSSSHSNPDKQDEPSLPEDGFGERIDELVAEIGVGELAEKSGISRRMLAKYRAGAEVNRRNLLALASAAHVRLEWLASGQEPKRSGTMVVKETGPGYDASGYVALPHYDVAASAGAGSLVASENLADWIYFKRQWLHAVLGVSPHRLAVIHAVGDSMKPTIDDGDLMLIDVGEGRVHADGVYVISVEDALLVKEGSRKACWLPGDFK